MIAHVERLLGSVRRECLDHMMIVGERQMLRVLTEYVRFHNAARPHQGLGQTIPTRTEADEPIYNGPVVALPVLRGLHHDYQRLAA